MLEVLALCLALHGLVESLQIQSGEKDAPVTGREGVVLPLGEVLVIVEPLQL